MSATTPHWNYPAELPVVEHREEILAAVRQHRVVVVVSDTGSGKTTQLPKMVAEALGPTPGRIGCTQPRRIAAASVAGRVAEELRQPLGSFVGYQVRFEERMSRETRIKFMTDGILLAETQGDRDLRAYSALILDEAHERSLNIDFLLGYLKQLLARRPDFKLIISSATLDAGSFAAFFSSHGNDAPVIEAPGRMFPVRECFLPPKEEEELPQHVARAVEFLDGLSHDGDTLIFLPGEREIRECADVLEGRKFRNAEILPLFARLGLADQQRAFHPGSRRRLILATNVAETSLTLPRISCVIDSGLARVSRWSPARGVQRLQIEPVSQASARQRKGRCGRLRDGICVRLYEETELTERPEFSDPEIRRSSLAGVILRMKSLGLPEIEDFPFLDPPSPKAIAEGYRTLREVGALDRDKRLTEVGRQIARLPIDPRLGRILIEARKEHCLADALPVVAALETQDPRERPADKQREADAAQARWRDSESDFTGILRMWRELMRFREGRGWRRNALRKHAAAGFLNYRRIIEWSNVCEELADLLAREWNCPVSADLFRPAPESGITMAAASYASLHRALLAGVPRQFGLWDREQKAYRSAQGGWFAVFPGSGLFGSGKRWEWVMGMELVETSRLWARRVARIDPEWVEKVAGHLCRSKYGEAHWDSGQGAVYGKETVICGGLPVVSGRRIHYGRVDARVAHAVFLREGLTAGGLRRPCRFLDRMEELKEELKIVERKLRRPGGLWSEEAVLRFYENRVPEDIHTAAAFHRWRESHEDQLMMTVTDVVDLDFSRLGLEGFPDVIFHQGEEFSVYYAHEPGERDDGVTLGVHLDQLPSLPEWLPVWGVDGWLAERAEALIRGLPKDYRRVCQPIAATAEGFASLWCGAPKDRPLPAALSAYILERCGASVPPEAFSPSDLPPHWITKIWVCDDEANELAMGDDVARLKFQLADHLRDRFEQAANQGIGRSGMHGWDGEALPDRVQTPGGPAFPALVDEGKSIGIRAFPNPEEAAEGHRAGGARLLRLAHESQVALLEKRFPYGLMARVELPRLGSGGTSMDDLLLLAAEGAADLAGCRIFPRSPADFAPIASQARGHWYDAACRIGRALDEILERLPPIREWIQRHRNDRNLAPVATDLAEQLDWLFRSRFLWRAGYRRLCDYPRRLRAIQVRLDRIAALPLVRDLEKTDRIRPLWEPWLRLWTGRPDDPRLWDLGWDIEEYRISLFAPDIPVLSKVSIKKLEQQIHSLSE